MCSLRYAQIHRPYITWALHVAALLVLFQTTALAQDSDDKVWHSFLNKTTIGLIRIDIDAVTRSEAAASQRDKPATADLSSLQRYRRTIEALQEAGVSKTISVLVDVPYTAVQSPIRIYLPDVNQEQGQDLLALHGIQPENLASHENHLLITPRYNASLFPGESSASRESEGQTDGTYPPLQTVDRPGFEAALSVIEKHPIRAVIFPPDYLRKTVRELVPQLPPELGGGPTATLLDGVQWLAIGVQPKNLETEVIVQANSEEAARAFASYLPKLLNAVAVAWGQPDGELTSPSVSQGQDVLTPSLARLAAPEIDGQRLRVRLEGESARALLSATTGFVDKVLLPFQMGDTVDQLKQIGLAVHNYHEVYRALPPAAPHRAASGEARLSWRVHLLPFLGEGELYEAFRLDEPWDSEHNRKLLARMPEIYAIPAPLFADTGPKGYTTLVAPVGEKTLFGQEQPVTFGSVVDGLSNTVMFLEVNPEHAVPWTAPRDYRFDPNDPLAGVLVDDDGMITVGYADGSVGRLNVENSAETILNLFQRDDGNTIRLR